MHSQHQGGYNYKIFVDSCTDKEYMEIALQKIKKQVINMHD